MSRVERYHEGRVPLHTLRADIDYGNGRSAYDLRHNRYQSLIFKGDLLQDHSSRSYE